MQKNPEINHAGVESQHRWKHLTNFTAAEKKIIKKIYYFTSSVSSGYILHGFLRFCLWKGIVWLLVLILLKLWFNRLIRFYFIIILSKYIKNKYKKLKWII